VSIVIIDDSSEERHLLRTILERAGYGPLVTGNSGQEALEHLGLAGPRAAGCDADVVLMDLMMPEIDGLEVCRRIRAAEHFEHLPIIVITAKTDAADLQAAYTAGATDFLRKPVMAVELVARVSTALSLKQELDARHAREQELVRKTAELEQANRELKSLRGLIAICAKCKRVRADGTYRKRIEDFLEQHLDAKIQRDICPTCLEQALPKAG
jgi:phosphoserine phosphatase RsbU/P